MNKTKSLLLLAGLAAVTAFAATACATPILDLNGQPMPSAYQQYTVGFTATQATTNITFAMRDDPAYIYLDTIVAASSGAPAVNLLTNGDFEGGTTAGPGSVRVPDGWQYLASSDTGDSTVKCKEGDEQAGSCAWSDGSDGGYDGITQAIATTIGDTYQISFWAYADDDGSRTWQTGTSDLMVYAGAVPSLTGVPEPAPLGMFGLGLLMLGGFVTVRRRHRGTLQA